MDQNIAQQYYQDEQARSRTTRPWLYWLILGLVVAVALVALVLA